MADEREEIPAKDFARIKPADISLGRVAPAQDNLSGQTGSKRHYLLYTSLAVLFISALVVIFILPEWITPQQAQQKNVSVEQNATPPVPVATSAPAPGASPWDEAQQAKLRKQTQDILAEMLEVQETLENKGVTSWAEKDYSKAMDFAGAGDKAYREHDFSEAQHLYQQGLETFTQLLAQMETVFAKALERGNQALTDGNSMTAKESFGLALLIKPDDADAIKGSKRAGTLDEVSGLIDQGDRHLQQGQLESAKKSYQQALHLDKYSGTAQQQLKKVNQKILDREFNQAMSNGYAALEKGDIETAGKSFTNALKLKPDAPEAQSAINQAKQSFTTTNIYILLTQAKQLAMTEQWQEAAGLYKTALTMDNSLVPAQQGYQYTSYRAALHARIHETLSSPDRLSDESVYNEAMSLQQELLHIPNPGPVLEQQIIQLATLLEQAITPVQVQFHSNNATDVIIYKVNGLGKFQATELSLKPGHYVAVGTRAGYRDVRVEFDVVAGKSLSPIVIQCEEKIALGR